MSERALNFSTFQPRTRSVKSAEISGDTYMHDGAEIPFDYFSERRLHYPSSSQGHEMVYDIPRAWPRNALDTPLSYSMDWPDSPLHRHFIYERDNCPVSSWLSEHRICSPLATAPEASSSPNSNACEHNQVMDRPSTQVASDVGSSGSDHPTTETTKWAEISKHASTLYAVLIMVTSACITLTAHLTHNINANYARWFDCAMLGTGILFLLYCIFFVLGKSKIPNTTPGGKKKRSAAVLIKDFFGRLLKIYEGGLRARFPKGLLKSQEKCVITMEGDSCSFYLKMGALIFAVGSMIYTCLEVGLFVENVSCSSIVMGIEPSFFIVFVTLQLYFLFRSSQIITVEPQGILWFGIIHLLATDLCVWIRILLDETEHEFKIITHHRMNDGAINYSLEFAQLIAESKESGSRGYAPLCVSEESTMKELLDKVSIFLYPCIIEYALITAGMTFTMWQLVGTKIVTTLNPEEIEKLERGPRQRYAVDCDQASRGLFAGIIVGVFTVVGIILFYIFIDQKELEPNKLDAGIAWQVMATVLNILAIFTTVYCHIQFVRKTRRIIAAERPFLELTDGLLMICMIGVYAHCVLCLLGTYATELKDDALSVMAATMLLVETSFQTVFIIDASKRIVCSEKLQQKDEKPAKEALTFLLVLNFAFWAVDIFCVMRTDASPIQMEFYGKEQWTVMLHVTIPLVIFYRFHSTACLVDIWKRAYKPQRKSNVVTSLLTILPKAQVSNQKSLPFS